IELSKKNIALIKTDRLPGISAIAGYNMQKPITNRVPILDMYSNTWSVGISLRYNIDNLYKNNKRVKLGELQKTQSESVLQVVNQNISMGINAAYTKYLEAATNVSILKEAMNLARENYRIIEAKYLNQLAIQAEMTDATNEKIEAEIKYSDAEINVLYQYYNLLKAMGTL
ncbi:MAG: TolC family protein, partial [Ferruginibacter sp.]